MAASADQIEVSGVALVAIRMKTHDAALRTQWGHPPHVTAAQRGPLIHIKRRVILKAAHAMRINLALANRS